jgi:hypothetical protein
MRAANIRLAQERDAAIARANRLEQRCGDVEFLLERTERLLGAVGKAKTLEVAHRVAKIRLTLKPRRNRLLAMSLMAGIIGAGA